MLFPCADLIGLLAGLLSVCRVIGQIPLV